MSYHSQSSLDKVIAFCKVIYGLDKQFVKMCVADRLDLFSMIAKEKNMSRKQVQNDMFVAIYGVDKKNRSSQPLRTIADENFRL